MCVSVFRYLSLFLCVSIHPSHALTRTLSPPHPTPTAAGTFKITRCKDKSNHDKRMCVYYHSKADRRRDPYYVRYSPSECPDYTEYTNCKDGDSCVRSHNMLERMFHPDLFKISMCQKPHSCERGQLCAFAHSEDDHRAAPPSTANLAYTKNASDDVPPAPMPTYIHVPAPVPPPRPDTSDWNGKTTTSPQNAFSATSGAPDSRPPVAKAVSEKDKAGSASALPRGMKLLARPGGLVGLVPASAPGQVLPAPVAPFASYGQNNGPPAIPYQSGKDTQQAAGKSDSSSREESESDSESNSNNKDDEDRDEEDKDTSDGTSNSFDADEQTSDENNGSGGSVRGIDALNTLSDLSDEQLSQEIRGGATFSNTTISMLLNSEEADNAQLKRIQQNIINLIQSAGPEGVISSEVPKRYEAAYGCKLELVDSQGERIRLKDVVLTQPGITSTMYNKGVQPRYVYDAEQAESEMQGMRDQEAQLKKKMDKLTALTFSKLEREKRDANAAAAAVASGDDNAAASSGSSTDGASQNDVSAPEAAPISASTRRRGPDSTSTMQTQQPIASAAPFALASNTATNSSSRRRGPDIALNVPVSLGIGGGVGVGVGAATGGIENQPGTNPFEPVPSRPSVLDHYEIAGAFTGGSGRVSPLDSLQSAAPLDALEDMSLTHGPLSSVSGGDSGNGLGGVGEGGSSQVQSQMNIDFGMGSTSSGQHHHQGGGGGGDGSFNYDDDEMGFSSMLQGLGLDTQRGGGLSSFGEGPVPGMAGGNGNGNGSGSNGNSTGPPGFDQDLDMHLDMHMNMGGGGPSSQFEPMGGGAAMPPLGYEHPEDDTYDTNLHRNPYENDLKQERIDDLEQQLQAMHEEFTTANALREERMQAMHSKLERVMASDREKEEFVHVAQASKQAAVMEWRTVCVELKAMQKLLAEKEMELSARRMTQKEIEAESKRIAKESTHSTSELTSLKKKVKELETEAEASRRKFATVMAENKRHEARQKTLTDQAKTVKKLQDDNTKLREQLKKAEESIASESSKLKSANASLTSAMTVNAELKIENGEIVERNESLQRMCSFQQGLIAGDGAGIEEPAPTTAPIKKAVPADKKKVIVDRILPTLSGAPAVSMEQLDKILDEHEFPSAAPTSMPAPDVASVSASDQAKVSTTASSDTTNNWPGTDDPNASILQKRIASMTSTPGDKPGLFTIVAGQAGHNMQEMFQLGCQIARQPGMEELKPPAKTTCSHTNCKNEGVFVCGCSQVGYCGVPHQMDHWRQHRKACTAQEY